VKRKKESWEVKKKVGKGKRKNKNKKETVSKIKKKDG
jgi:hypothetical protein